MRSSRVPWWAAVLAVLALAASAGTASASAPAAGATKSGTAAAAARRLEDIRIEGDVPVPQVIFVTARDPRRFMEFQHHRYLKSSLELGRETVLPGRVHLVGSWPTTIHKESAP